MGSGVPRIGLANQQRGFIIHTHYTMHEVVLAPGPGLLTQVPAIVHDPSTLSGSSPAWPKFKACKQVTQHPLVRWVHIFHGGLGWTGGLKVSR